MKRRLFIQQTSLFTASLISTRMLSNLQTDSFALIEPVQAASSLKELNFGIISTESQANQRPAWEPFIAAMSKAIGIKVKPFYVTQYAAVIEAMRFGQIQVAWYGGKSYVEAVRIANAEAFAQVVNADGTRGYYSYLIGNKANPLTAQAKAQGGYRYILKNASKITFAFNDPNSTSGFLVPSYYIFAKNNVDPRKAFKRLIFAGSHEANALAVANRQVDFATTSSDELSRIVAKNPIVQDRIEIIWKSPILPSDPIAYRQDLPKDIKIKLQNFFYNYKDTTVLEPLKWAGFVPANDTNWNGIRELDIAKKITEIEIKPILSNQDKNKLNELKQQLRRLQKKS